MIEHHDDCRSERLSSSQPEPIKPSSTNPSVESNTCFTLTKLCKILVSKCFHCGVEIYTIELSMCFTFAWFHSRKKMTAYVAAVVETTLTGPCIEKSSDLGKRLEVANRGDKPLTKCLLDSKLTMQMHASPFISSDDGKRQNESTFGLSANCTAVNGSNYSTNSYKSQIAVGLQHSKLTGVESVADKATDKVKLNKQSKAVNNGQHSYREPEVYSDHYKQYTRRNNWEPPTPAWKTKECMQEPAQVALSGYTKPAYAVLVGSTVMVCDTSKFASLPNHSKFMVKERIQDSSGTTKVKLALKSCKMKRYIFTTKYWCMNYNHQLIFINNINIT